MKKPLQLSEGERLILLMLCEIKEHLKLKDGTDTELVKEAIYSGNIWGLDWGMPGVFHGSETPESVVTEMVHILAMWQRLEESFNSLTTEEKEWLAKESDLGKDVKFYGFDGNSQIEVLYISAARFMVDHLDRFQNFKGRDFNAHMPTLEAYRRMLPVFEPILHQVLNKDFSAAQIAKVLDAYRHPDAPRHLKTQA
jgi:uncharacterized protein YfbU (UPF0304 family)